MGKIFLFVALFQVLAFPNTEGYVLLDSKWSSTNISVCWDTPGFNTEKAWVKSAIENSWESVSKIRFNGWESCPGILINGKKNFDGIRIRINDEGPHTVGLGNQIEGIPYGMVLNFTFQNWSTVCQYEKQFCIETIAKHEFGHALGLAHEQNRPDHPDYCLDKDGQQWGPQGTNGNVMIGNWDANSIMNYCQENWNNGGELSNGDIETVNFLYPFKLTPPKDISPPDLSKKSGASALLSWTQPDPYFSENISFDVYFGETNPPTTVVAQGISATSFVVNDLKVNKNYFWKIDVHRSQHYVKEIYDDGFFGLFSTYSQDQLQTKELEPGTVWQFNVIPPITATILSVLLQ